MERKEINIIKKYIRQQKALIGLMLFQAVCMIATFTSVTVVTDNIIAKSIILIIGCCITAPIILFAIEDIKEIKRK